MNLLKPLLMAVLEDSSKIPEFEVFNLEIFNFDWNSIRTKVCITTSSRPSSNTHIFATCLKNFIPNSDYIRWDSRSRLHDLYESLKKDNYTHSLIIFENQKKIHYLTIAF